MSSSPPPPRVRPRQAALTAAGVVLVGAGLYIASGWPLLIGGLLLLMAAVKMR